MIQHPTFKDIKNAAERIKSFAHRTPVLTCQQINRMVNADIYFKCENFQKVGAFKFRGASNAVFSLSDDEAKLGVVTHSSGNFAAAISLAAKIRGIPAYIIMPNTAPQVKKIAVAGYGGKIIYCEPNLKARETTAEKVINETGATLIHSYNDFNVICGQGTACLELLEDIQNLDMILTPIGGGGLISGTAIAASNLSPGTKILAGEPSGADDAYRSLKEGKIIPSVNPDTIADGLLTSLGTLTFSIIKKHIYKIITVDDTETIKAMRTIWERMKIIIEPSSAVPVAVLLEKKIDVEGKKIGVILSGGNVDLDKLPWMSI